MDDTRFDEGTKEFPRGKHAGDFEPALFYDRMVPTSLFFVSRLQGRHREKAETPHGEIAMSLSILFDENKLDQPKRDDSVTQNNNGGWPKDTWFQRRLRHVREQQRKKMAEGDVVYECALGTITIRQSNGGNGKI